MEPKQNDFIVADEQNYHFQALFDDEKAARTLCRWLVSFIIWHGGVAQSGRMKSREGTVVDADDLIDEITNEVASNTLERNENGSFDPN